MSAAELATTVEFLIADWPSSRYVINLCEDRFYFLLAWLAACLREQTTLLPPDSTPITLNALRTKYPAAEVIDDSVMAESLAKLKFKATRASSLLADARIEADRVVAIAFTSGSTGSPSTHEKTWGMLLNNARMAANEVLGGSGSPIVATVPAQHIYGLETSVLTVLAARCTLFAGKPFFPADVREALASVGSPCTLVTTPAHLRVLIESEAKMPALARIVSATASLPLALAQRIERDWQAPVFEIYGCTEAGIVAMRRTVESNPWRLFSDGEITMAADTAYYRTPQFPAPIALQDVIEPSSAKEFWLRGRRTDLIKVAGKRASLEALTHELLAIDGVRDAAIFVPEADARPAAFVVAPTLSESQLLKRLHERIDPAFVPRPLIMMDALPRDRVGKLPRRILMEILSAHRRRLS